MPQMGESVTEGTVLGWLKQVGDRVEADEPLVEVSTDKVDAEVPAPASGTLIKILAEPDSTVEVGAILGEIEVGDNGAAPAAEGPPQAEAPPEAEAEAAEEPAEQAPPAEEAPPETADAELVDVAFPEMGDSVAEGTVLEWRVAVGDTVAVDDPLVEISTDKVDADMPSPVAGTIAEILVEPDTTVAVGTVLLRIAAGAGAPAKPPRARGARPRPRYGRQRRRQRHARGRTRGERPWPRRRLDHRHRAPREGHQGGRPRRDRGRPGTRRRARAQADPRPGRHARAVHGREPLDPHRHQLPHPPGGRARCPPPRAQGRRPQAELHPPDRLGGGPGRARHAGDGQLLHRAGRQAPARRAGRDQPRPRRGRGAQGRHPLAGGPRARQRQRARLRGLRGQVRRAGRRRPRQHALARRLLRRQHQPHQPRRHRHRGQRAAADARAGDDRRHRRDRLSARPHRGHPRGAEGAGRPEGHDDDLDLRPPGDPGRRVGRLPAPSRPAAPGRGRLLRRRARSARPGRRRHRRRRPDPGDRRRARAGRRHARRGGGRGRGAAPGGPGRHQPRQGTPHARPPRGAARPARLRAGRRSGARPRHRAPDRRPDAAHPGLGAARGGPGRHVRGCPAAPARGLHRHDRLRDRAHLRARAARLAAPGDRMRRLPQAAQRRGAARAARAPVGGRGARDLPPQGLPREEAVLDRGPRLARADARPGDRAGLRRGRARGRARDGAPRPPQRARAQRLPTVRVDPGGVRGRADAVDRHGRPRGRNRRREVPLRRVGHLQDTLRARRDRDDVAQPEPPRVRQPRDRGPLAGRPDDPQGARARPRPQRRAAGADPRRRGLPRPGHRRRDAQPAGARGLLDRRHAARDRQQPARLHHRPEREPLDALRVGSRKGLRHPDHPRQRRRRGGVHLGGAPGPRLPADVQPRRADRPDRLPPLRPQRDRRAGLHAAVDVRADQEAPAGAPALRGAARRRGRRLDRGGGPDRESGLRQAWARRTPR